MFGLTALHGFNATFAASYIRSIQQVSITIPSAANTATGTISSVTAGNTILIYQGSDPSGGTGPNNCSGYVTLTNGTTVTAVRQASTVATTLTLYCTVVEFISAAVNVSAQYATITIANAATSNTATISSVNTANASIFFLGMTAASGSANANFFSGITLTNGTTVTATRSGNTGANNVTCCVIEWATAVVKSAQHRTFTIGSGSQSNTDTISAVTTSNTLILPGGSYEASSTPATAFCYLSLTNGTTVTAMRTGTTGVLSVAYDVLEFQPGVLKSAVQRGTITLTSVTSNTATITAVDTAKSTVNFNGYSTAETGVSVMPKSTVNTALTNTTTVTAAMDTANANGIVAAYEVAEFA